MDTWARLLLPSGISGKTRSGLGTASDWEVKANCSSSPSVALFSPLRTVSDRLIVACCVPEGLGAEDG